MANKNPGFAALGVLQSQLSEKPSEDTTETLAEDQTPPEQTASKETDTLVEVTINEVPVIEPIITLNDKPVSEWTTEELESYIKGEFDGEIYHSTVVKAIAEHRVRATELSAAWSIQECKEFLSQGIKPAVTSKGAWVNDITRASRREHAWSTEELESWALGEIKAEGNTIDSGLAIELKKRLGLTVPGVDVKDVLLNYRTNRATPEATVQLTSERAAPIEPVAEAEAEVPTKKIYPSLTAMNQSYLESSLEKFAKVMAPGRAVSEADGGAAQKLLMEVFNYAIGLQDPQASKQAMLLIFDTIKANRAPGKLFEDTYAFRFIDNMRATVTQQRSHAALLTLFVTYADEATELRYQTDVPSLIKGVNPAYQSRLLEFFSKL